MRLSSVPAILMSSLLLACTTPSEMGERAGEAEVPGAAAKTPALEEEKVLQETPQEPEPSVAPLWDREGLDVQPRLDELARRTPPEMEYEPGTTDWRPSQWELPKGLTSPGEASPQSAAALLFEVGQALGEGLGEEIWEVTTRLWQEGEGRATGMIMRWGFKDDAMAGSDLRVSMTRVDDRWIVEKLEERFHCTRGVSENLCL